MTIQEFIDKSEWHDTYKQTNDWNGYKVYDIWAKANEGACVGYPQFALEKDGEIRQSTLEETIAIMRASRTNEND